MNRTARIATVILASLTLLGCPSSYSDICTTANDCVGGNDADLDACIASAEAEEDRAAAYGCDAEYEAYFTCYEESLDCNDEQLEIDSDCVEDEGEDLGECLDDGSDLDD